MATVGAVASYVTVSAAVPVLPAASLAVTVSTLAPGCRAMPLTDHGPVPVAVPLPPRSLLHVTWVTPTSSLALPPSASGLAFVEYEGAGVGAVMVTVGNTASGAV